MKRRTVILAAAAATVLLLASAPPRPPILVWNASASLPVGLYLIRGKAVLRVGERVALDPPPKLREFLTGRGYLPDGVPLLKEVAGLPGDRVCRSGAVVTINDKPVGLARAIDSRSQVLPGWQGCRIVAADQVFVMNRRAPDSFDGRYFGVLACSSVIGRAIPVWTNEASEGGFAWFARPSVPTTPNHKPETYHDLHRHVHCHPRGLRRAPAYPHDR
ncbi:S26 family signal peptidase [Erythrobacter sp.]|uniref:S26 family signal peptidase n=1 Tax=Erythrobacter sp. TaxID=1042 RepID=UPI00311DAF6B